MQGLRGLGVRGFRGFGFRGRGLGVSEPLTCALRPFFFNGDSRLDRVPLGSSLK